MALPEKRSIEVTSVFDARRNASGVVTLLSPVEGRDVVEMPGVLEGTSVSILDVWMLKSLDREAAFLALGDTPA